MIKIALAGSDYDNDTMHKAIYLSSQSGFSQLDGHASIMVGELLRPSGDGNVNDISLPLKMSVLLSLHERRKDDEYKYGET